ncbi:MAG: NUDIX domain-containing protein [Candidatus Magasanikbacteria bacterium]|nr:NUDIX domain-containing protein [Candidatus Magasanikbacteria bacterium]
MPKERFKLIPAVHLFLIKSNKILLLRRFNTGYEDGNYSVPAGHLDGDESVITAVVRETKEETGITIDPKNIRVVHVMHRIKFDGERIDFFLTANSWSGEPSIQEPNKCDELKWFPLSNLPMNVIPYVHSALENFQAGVAYSEFGW